MHANIFFSYYTKHGNIFCVFIRTWSGRANFNYWDSVSDHILRLLVLSVLGVFLAQQSENGIIYAVVGISIHAITQLEHIISDFILKGVDKPQSSKDRSNGIINKIILLINNIYLFYFIFILLNRIDLLFIVLPIIQLILFSKRFIQFSYSKY